MKSLQLFSLPGAIYATTGLQQQVCKYQKALMLQRNNSIERTHVLTRFFKKQNPCLFTAELCEEEAGKEYGFRSCSMSSCLSTCSCRFPRCLSFCLSSDFCRLSQAFSRLSSPIEEGGLCSSAVPLVGGSSSTLLPRASPSPTLLTGLSTAKRELGAPSTRNLLLRNQLPGTVLHLILC